MEKKEKEQMNEEILDAYFQFRRNLPESGAVQQNMTTQQIQDDLLTMAEISMSDIVTYMAEHDYSLTTERDGSVAWAIWRVV